MKPKSLKVLAELFYSRAVGRLGLGPDPLGYGFGAGSDALSHEPGSMLTDSPTKPMLPPVQPSGPRMKSELKDADVEKVVAETRAFSDKLNAFIRSNVNNQKLTKENVRYWYRRFMGMREAVAMIIDALSSSDISSQISKTYRCMRYFHELNIEFARRAGSELEGLEEFRVALMGLAQVLDDVVFDESYKEVPVYNVYDMYNPEESVA